MKLPATGVARTLATVQRRLGKDAFFTKVGGKRALGELARRLDPVPKTFEQLFGEALQGTGEAVRYAGALLAAQLCGRGPATRLAKAQRLGEGAARFYAGDVSIAGHLMLASQAILVVAGDLRVEGNVVAGPDYTLIAAGGTIDAENLMSSGEVIAGRALRVSGCAYLHGNDYSAVAPRVRAGALVENDRTDRFGEVAARKRYRGFLYRTEEAETRLAEVAGWLGLPAAKSAEELERMAWDAWSGIKPRKRAPGPGPAPVAAPVVDCQQAMRDAVAEGSVQKLAAALATGADPKREPDGAALYAAARSGSDAMVRLLLAAGADPDRAWKGMRPAFADSRYPEITRLLVAAGADVGRHGAFGRTLLHVAAQVGSGSVDVLLAAGTPVDARDRHGWTPLHCAAAHSGTPATVRVLLAGGAEVDPRTVGPEHILETKGGETPLWLACWRGHEAIGALLLDAGADVNARNRAGETPLAALRRSPAKIDLSRFATRLAKRGAGA